MMRTAIEAGVYLALCFAFFSIRAVRAYAAALPSPHRWIFGTFFCVLLAGQLINQPRLTFPMTSWALYGRPEHPDTLVFYHYQGFDQRGEVVALDPFRLLAPLGRAEVASKIKNLSREAFSNQHTARQKAAQRQITALLRAIGTIYNGRHPERSVRSVEMIQCSVDLRDHGLAGIRYEPIWRVELTSAGAT